MIVEIQNERVHCLLVGLWALKTEEVCEMMQRDYPDKYQVKFTLSKQISDNSEEYM